MITESKYCELKENMTTSYLKTVSAFANYFDGMIIFGISDSGDIVGIKNKRDFLLDIENQINNSISPRPDFNLIMNSDDTITLLIKKGPFTPYYYNHKTYKRNDTSTVEVSELELRRLCLEGTNTSYDELPIKNKNLTFETLSKYFKDIAGISEFSLDIQKSLKLYKDDSYNNAASLLSDSNNFYGVDIVQFGESENIFKDRLTLNNCSLLKQYQDAMKMFDRLYSFDEIKDGERKKVELIPREAFREALANAIVHRVYDVNANTKISMYYDKIVISSPGGLLPNYSKEDYLNGSYSLIRNNIIAFIFLRLNIIEEYGTGVRRIRRAYQDSLIKPSFDITENCITVTLPTFNKKDLNVCEADTLQRLDKYVSYTRSQIEKITGYSKDKVIRIINSLILKGYMQKTGNNKSIMYMLKL
ncbi:MAG: putative DNA binding domain-containing protein [Firmicutes bacterium]|nr:putative DNA binding domain-containing protein [Candidatus Fiminaster equi]